MNQAGDQPAVDHQNLVNNLAFLVEHESSNESQYQDWAVDVKHEVLDGLLRESSASMVVFWGHDAR